MQIAILAALIPAHPSTSEMFMFMALGFCVVLIVLSVISLVTATIGKLVLLFDKLKNRSVKKAQSSAGTTAPAANGGEGVPVDHAFVIGAAVASVLPELKAEGGELIAVLAAAASEALEADIRIVSFKPVDMSYAKQGRSELFSSHNYTPRAAGRF